jgi:outer membrane protein assembly factor BamD (BamD/ComL family)
VKYTLVLLVAIPALALAATSADEYYAEANQLWAQGKVADAYLSFSKALNMSPSAVWSAYAIERLALLSTAAPDEQLKVLGKAAVALDATDYTGAITLLRDYQQSGLLTERLKPWLALYLARGMGALKRYDEADGVLIAELARHPDDPAAPRLMLEQIRLKLTKGDKTGASDVWDKMAKVYPDSAELELAKGLLGK